MSIMENMLNMIDKEHSIVLSEDIGLIGNYEYNVEKTFGKLRKVYDYYPDVRLGNKFKVVTSDAIILLEEFVDSSGILYEPDGKISYIFKLADYTVVDSTWALLDESLSEHKPAMIYYKDNKIQTNCKILCEKYEYNSRIECEISNNRIVRLNVNGIKYTPKTISFENSIYSFMHTK